MLLYGTMDEIICKDFFLRFTHESFYVALALSLLLSFMQFTDTTHATTELQQNGIPEEVEPTTTPQPPPTTASQEYVYEPTVDHVTTETVGHTEGALETEQFTTPSEPETKSE